MLLTRVFKRLLRSTSAPLGGQELHLHRRVLCIASAAELATMPYHYAAWKMEPLGATPLDGALFVKRLQQLTDLRAASYDAVYCSYKLNGHSLYEGGLILHHMGRLLKTGGFLHLKVPNVLALMYQLVDKGHDLEDVAYVSASGPILYHDALWGLGNEVANEGRKSKGHRSGYSRKVLDRVLSDNGFQDIRHIGAQGGSELEVIAAVDRLHDDYRILLGLKSQTP